MRHVVRLLVSLISIVLLLTSSVHADKQPTSYCKCICFQNSTIIPLNSPPSQSTSPLPSPRIFARKEDAATSNDHDESEPESKQQQQQQHHRTLTCNDCNRAFCLDYNLPICKNAKEEEVFAQCFQRDSLKDRTIVTIFILATTSLLCWAILKPFIVKNRVGDVVQKYVPVGTRTGPNDGGAEDGEGLPGPRGNNAGPSRSRAFGAGVGGSGSDRPGRSGRAGRAGGRGSISRQGGLNS